MAGELHRNSIQKINSYVDHITALNYKETPVDVLTFLKDDHFIGRSTNNSKAIYPGWFDPIQEIFYNDSKYLVVLTGSIGIGKSTIAIYCMAYILYKISCLRDPHLFFKLAGTDSFAVSFFNLTKNLGDSRGFQKLMNVLMLSPWFKEHGGSIRGKENQYLDLPLYSWKLSSPYAKGFGIVGEDVLLGIMDEVDDPTISEGQKQRVLKTYEATSRRFESRFVYDMESISRFFLVSSKQDELSFLETFVEDMKGSDRVLVIDKPQWDIKPKSNYSGNKFFVLVGDAYNPSRIISSAESVELMRLGKNVHEIPEELKFDFERDIVGALRDLAGISVRGIRRYKLFPAERFVEACFEPAVTGVVKRNPFSQETIEIGLDDDIELVSLLDFSAIRSSKSVMRFIHMDIGITDDCLGLAMSAVVGWAQKDIQKEDGTFVLEAVPVVETDFAVRFKARQHDRIPLHKIRKLVLDIRARGYFIKIFSADLRLASEDTTQILMKAGIECEYFSLDKSIQPYMEFRNMVFEKRWIYQPANVLYLELVNLEHNKDENKVDHPIKVKIAKVEDDGTVVRYSQEGSKDISDAVAGSVFMAVKYAEKPLDIDEAVKSLVELRSRAKPAATGFSGDWFINTGKLDDQGKKEVVLVKEADQVLSMIEALKKNRQRKPI